MVKNLILSSTILRILIFLNLGLPALKPIVEQINPNITSDSVQVKKEIVKGPLFAFTNPDGLNTSILGDFINNIQESSLILFTIFIVWGTALRFQSSKNESLIFILTILAITAINIHLISHLKTVIWGFWVVYTLAMNLLIFEVIIIFNQQKKSAYQRKF